MNTKLRRPEGLVSMGSGQLSLLVCFFPNVPWSMQKQAFPKETELKDIAAYLKSMGKGANENKVQG
jgi:hypothetical protein